MTGAHGVASGGLIVIATKNNGKVKEFAHAFGKLGISVASLNDYPQIPDIPEDGDTFAANARIKAKAAGDALGVPALADDSGLRVEALGGAPGVYSARYAGQDATDADNNAKLLRELAAADGAEPERRELAGTAGNSAEPGGALAGTAGNSTEPGGAFAGTGANGAVELPSAGNAAERGLAKSAAASDGLLEPERAFSGKSGTVPGLPEDDSQPLSRAQFVCALALYNPATGTFIEAEGTVDGIITDKPHGDGGFGYDPLFWLPQLGRGMAELTKEEKERISHRGAALRQLLSRLE